jgi:hypothetical protein
LARRFSELHRPYIDHGPGLLSFKRPQRETDAGYYIVLGIEHGDAEQSDAAEEAGDQTLMVHPKWIYSQTKFAVMLFLSVP